MKVNFYYVSNYTLKHFYIVYSSFCNTIILICFKIKYIQTENSPILKMMNLNIFIDVYIKEK